jgi:arginase
MKLCVITVPYDSGHHNKRLGLGPNRLLPHIADQLIKSGHTIRHQEIVNTSSFQTEITTSFELGMMTASCVKEAAARDEFPIIVSGNCNTAAMGATCGQEKKPGVIWFDCHADFNTPETTMGGFFDGMALSIIAGQCWTQLSNAIPGFKPIPEEKIILAGVRDVDPLESLRVSHSKITVIAADEFKSGRIWKGPTIDGPVYLHIDLDVIDSDIVKVNTYSSAGGLTPQALVHAIKTIKDTYSLSAVSFTAYDPALDPDEKVPAIVKMILEVIFG